MIDLATKELKRHKEQTGFVSPFSLWEKGWGMRE
jgi:hypothetical protein